jgi:hypothetical protein
MFLFFFTVKNGCLPHAQHPSRRTTPAVAYSMYSQLPSIWNPRTHYALVTRDPTNMVHQMFTNIIMQDHMKKILT